MTNSERQEQIKEDARKYIDMKLSCSQKRVSKATVKSFLIEFAESQVNKYLKDDSSS